MLSLHFSVFHMCRYPEHDEDMLDDEDDDAPTTDEKNILVLHHCACLHMH